FDQPLQNSIYQAQRSIIKPRLQAADSSRTDHSRRFANIHSRQARCVFEQRVRRNSDARADHAAHVLPFRGDTVECRRSSEIHHHAWPPYFSKAATAFTMRSAPTSAGFSYSTGIPVFTPGSMNNGLVLKYRSQTCRSVESRGGTTEETTIP